MYETITLLKVSPVNARLPSPSYIHQYIFYFRRRTPLRQ